MPINDGEIVAISSGVKVIVFFHQTVIYKLEYRSVFFELECIALILVVTIGLLVLSVIFHIPSWYTSLSLLAPQNINKLLFRLLPLGFFCAIVSILLLCTQKGLSNKLNHIISEFSSWRRKAVKRKRSLLEDIYIMKYQCASEN